MNENALRVRLDVFDGPLDLLLHLVKERQLDIATVPLAAVAEQYLQYVSMMEQLDIEVAAEYLVVAATLVFLKSRALLPPVPAAFADEQAETPEQVEEQLRRRLIAYSRYKEVGEHLRERLSEAAAYYYREGGDPLGELVQRYRIPKERLIRALVAMLSEPRAERRTIARERISLIAQMDYIMQRLREAGSLSFRSLCRELGRETLVVTFLALLELVRRRRVDVRQDEPFGEIAIVPVLHSVERAS